MKHQDLINFLEFSDKDPSRLIFEDELTDIYNRRFLFHYFQHKVSWTRLQQDPLSLIMMDVDHFKQVNDTYGHLAGDQVLVWIAGLLREVAGEAGMPIRYAGDEFMILLVHSDRRAALELGQRFMDRVRSKHIRPEGYDIDLQITLSIGVASAPQDARSSKELIQKADIALYYAKQIGRNCLINAADVEQESVFAKTAIYQLEDVKLVGRDQQLAKVSEALNKFSQHRNQFLVAEGPEGIGKSEFLDTIRRSLARINLWRVKVSGEPRENFRPYYLVTRVLMDLLNQHNDKGAAVIDNLLPMERGYIARVIPQFGQNFILPKDLNQTSHRQFIFTAVYNFLVKLIGDRPMVLFIDDLDYADEATLLLLRQMMGHTDMSVFICGSTTVTPDTAAGDTDLPLNRFCAGYQEEIGIQKLMLTSLTESDIDKHIRTIFPNARVPVSFTSVLANISQGNPLFLSEILRKLVQDRKIILTGHQWNIEPLQETDLPHSLEEMVTQKISALDEESRKMLDQVSAFGEDVSLSMLTGSSDQHEARVLEFIDQAVNQGLLSSRYQLNDEVIRFLGKRILHATYNAIEEDRRQQLHQRIGTYQESLYDQQLLPSASALAYHFKRSADVQKASDYDTVLSAANTRNFDNREALYYTVETPVESAVAEVPLKSDDLNRIPKFLRLFMVALRNVRLYPPGSKSIANANTHLKRVIDKILNNNDTLNILRFNQAVLVNGQKLNLTEYKLIADTFLQFLNRFELQGIAFHKGLSANELEIVLQAFGKTKQKMFEPKHWQRFSAENQLRHIELKQTHYAFKAKSNGVLVNPGSVSVSGEKLTPPVAAVVPQKPLGTQELGLIPDILLGLISASKTVKLYATDSSAAATALNNLMGTLRRFFHWQPFVSISQISNNLLVNGEKVDISGVTDFSGIVVGILKFLDDLDVENLTILKQVTVKQMQSFLNALAQMPTAVTGAEYWPQIAESKGLSTILFDQHQIEIQVPQNLAGQTQSVIVAQGQVPISKVSVKTSAVPKKFADVLADFSEHLEDLFLKGDQAGIRHLIAQLFEGLKDRRPSERNRAVEVCSEMMGTLDLAFQHDAIRSFVNPLLTVLAEEKEPKIVAKTARLLLRMVTLLIQFGDYSLASRIIINFQKRHHTLKEAKDSQAFIFAKILEASLDAQAQSLVVEDLKSDDPTRQQPAAHLLGSLGRAVMPQLIDIIKKQDNYRARHTAATLLGKLGPKAIERLKRSLVLEINPPERKRILEIIDILTTDVSQELIFGIGDENPQVREAAYHLAERLKDGVATDLLLDFAKDHDGDLAAGAIKCLGRLQAEGVEAQLISLLNSSNDERLCIACCRALGRIGKSTGIEPLAAMLMPKRVFIFRKKRSAQLRAAAAVALGQISDPRAAKHLANYIHDKDSRVREIARNALDSST